MAQSPSHKFGQLIGNLLEATVEPFLQKFAHKHGLYLDKKGPRPARKGQKVTWIDLKDNLHDLDFVLERGGGAEVIGVPVAFVESAWRRYTKHSRNKAQEIQGAILPLVAAHQASAPFTGVFLAGIFTEGALKQLRSLGFHVVYLSQETVVEAFSRVRIDARFGEATPDTEFARKIRAWERLTKKQRLLVIKTLTELNSAQIDDLMQALERSITRQIKAVRILPLHGTSFDWTSIEDAIIFIEGYVDGESARPIIRFEIEVQYNNGDTIKGVFTDKSTAIKFLKDYQPVLPQPAKQ